MLAEKGIFMQQEKRSIGTLKQAWDTNLGAHFHIAYYVVNLRIKVTPSWLRDKPIFKSREFKNKCWGDPGGTWSFIKNENPFEGYAAFVIGTSREISKRLPS
jgi:hypothetical protein